MRREKLWQTHEREIQEALGLLGTVASGSQWTDIGDGVTHKDHPIPTIVDAKCTEKASYSLKSSLLDDWQQKAAEQGKMFLLPLRFQHAKTSDYVVLSLDDFLTLWELSKKQILDN